MVTSYVTALNTPGTVPNVEKAWEVFVSTKCTQVKAAATETYDKTMESELAGKLPCERDIIRQAQLTALEKALKLFEEETFGISTENIEKYLNELTVRQSYIVSAFLSLFFTRKEQANRKKQNEQETCDYKIIMFAHSLGTCFLTVKLKYFII